MDKDKLQELMFKAWWWARVYALYAAIVFAILWLIASSCSGCAAAPDAPVAHAEPKTEEPLSERLSGMMAEMRRAGCWPTAYSLTYSNPTSYSVTVSGKYYDALDLSRTNNTDTLEKKGL